MADGSLVIAVADAKGHGFSSALVMALTRAYVRCFAAMQLELDDILARVNQMLLKDLEHGHFVTLFLARLRPQDGTLSYASAGHVPGFVLRDSGELKCTLDSTGPPLGLFPGSKFTLHHAIQLDPRKSQYSSPTESPNRPRPTDASSALSVFLTTFAAEATIPPQILRMASIKQHGRLRKMIYKTMTSPQSSSKLIGQSKSE